MAVNKNFVVKNGLEVNTDLLFADSATRSVGVGSTSPNFDLDVRGGIGATDLRVTGFTTLTKDFQVGASGSAFYVSNTNNLVGVGTSVPAFLMDIRSSVSSGQTALYVKGDMRVTGDINLDDLTIDDLTVTGIATYKPDGSGGSPDSWIDIDYTGNTTTGGGTTVGFGSTAYFVDEAKVVFGAGEDLTIGHVGGLNVIGGAVKFSDATQSSSKDTGSVILEGGAGIEKNLFVGGGAEVTGVATVTGTLDANGALTVAGTADFASDVDIDDATQSSSTATGALKVDGGVGIVKNLFVGGGAQVTGVTTITGTLDANGALDVDGHTELDDVNVAGAATFAGAIDANSTSDFNGVVTVSNTTQSSSKDTGAIIVEGGAGIEKNLFVGGGAQVTGVTTITGTLDANGALDVDGHTELDDVNVAGASTFAGAIDANATTQSSASTNGAATFAGGVGVAKNLFAGGGVSVGAAFTVGSGIGITTILDQDDMAANSATALASQQSIKAYVDTQITAEDLDFSGDSGTGAVDLDSQTLAISGTASEIKTVASGQSLTISLPDDIIVGNGLTVTGIGSFLNDVNFRGKSGLTSAFWDKSESSLKWNDNVKAQFGDSQDLSIYHDGNDTWIKDTGTRHFNFTGAQYQLMNVAATEFIIKGVEDGSVEQYFNGSKKFETGPAGVIVTGIATASGFRAADGVTNGVKIGDGEDLIIQHNGTNSFIDNNTGDLYIQTTGSGDDILIEAADDFQVSANSKTAILAIGDAEVQLYHNNAKKLESSSHGAVVTGILTATGGFNIGIQSGHTLINTGVGNSIGIVTAINFVGSGNTVVYNSSTKTVDIAISGGSGGISTTYQNISSTSATGIATFAVATYRAASIVLSVTQGTSYQAGRYMVIHDGTTPTVVEESAIATGSMLASFDATIGSGNLTFRATMSSSGLSTVGIKVDPIISDAIPA